jgi:ApbE superfamily uncharacterized protein (UPF0280 family)
VHAKVEIAETAATIAADGRYVESAVEALKSARREVERQVRRDPFFLTTLEPYTPDDPSPLVRRMCEAADAVGVGPMATVAGAIAQATLEAMAAEGCDHGWVDNGGDIALILGAPVTMEVFHQPGARTAFGMVLGPAEGTFGVCSSSGRLGHSISLGDADVALAIADSAIVADAVATSVGNRVTDRESLRTCFRHVKDVPGLRGGLAMMDGEVAIHGQLPELVEVEHNPERLTVHSAMPARCHSSGPTTTEEVRT